MPFSSGTFSRVHDFTDDRDNGIRIQASRMDAEMDGIATGLSTALLKDGTQTATATIPFAAGISIIDNQKITLGTNSDITLQYDETTNDSLEIAANVEGAALGIVLKSDQGDDNADQHKLSIADGGVLTLGSKISGSFVDYLTHTPNSTVASSTLAVAGNLTVGGNLTLGSGAVLSEAELEQLDGITAGTVTASKAVVVDANKDIASFRNVTLTGELDAATGDFSGDVDVDGTLEADAITVNGTALATVIAGTTVTTATNANHVSVADNESTNEENLIPFIEDASATGNVGLESDGDFAYNPSTGTVSATVFKGNIDAVDGDFDGTLEADAMTLNGTAITATATLDTGISNNNVPKFTSGVVDDDFLRVNGTAIEGRSASEVLSDIGASAVAGSSSIVTTGALDSGSITSGFGNINIGSSTITTTGAVGTGALTVGGAFTSQGIDDNADAVAITIDSSERVGIGLSSSIDRKLHVENDNDYAVKFGGTASGDFAIEIGQDGSNGSPAINATAGSMKFKIAGTEAMRIDTSRRVMIGESSNSGYSNNADDLIVGDNGSSTERGISFGSTLASTIRFNDGSDAGIIEYVHSDNSMRFGTNNGTERMRISSSGNVGIGNLGNAATLLHIGSTGTPEFRVQDLDAGGGYLTVTQGSGVSTISADPTNSSGSPTLVLKTNNSERMRIQGSSGNVLIGTTSSMDLGFGAQRLSVRTTDGDAPAIFGNAHASSGASVIAYHAGANFNSNLSDFRCARANNSAYNFAIYRSSSNLDTEFYLGGDGNAYADGSWNGGGADYAEYFEWKDGNTDNEDRRGYTVVLDGHQIRKSTSDDNASTIIGVVSGNPSMVGDSDINQWKHKYQRDDYGTYVRDENGDRVLNSSYDETKEYVNREDRQEWDTVGLMGKLRIRVGQTVGSNWIKMREISDTVHEYLVR